MSSTWIEANRFDFKMSNSINQSINPLEACELIASWIDSDTSDANYDHSLAMQPTGRFVKFPIFHYGSTSRLTDSARLDLGSEQFLHSRKRLRTPGNAEH